MFAPSLSHWIILSLCFRPAFTEENPITVTLYDLGYSDMAASVIKADATATTYSLACAFPDPSACGFLSIVPSFTAVGGPSTGALSVDDHAGIKYTYNCDITSSTARSCAYTSTIGETKATTTIDIPPGELTYIPVPVTAGAEKLKGVTASSTASGSTASGSASSASDSSASASSASASSGSAATASSTGAAAPMNTVHFGGAVAALAGVVLAAL